MDSKIKKMMELDKEISKVYRSFDKKTKGMSAEKFFKFADKHIHPLTKKI